MYESNSKDVMAIVGSLLVIGFFAMLPFVKFNGSEEMVSGIVYNTKLNRVGTGNTKFSVRAAVDTYVSEENSSQYCLPPGSPYQKLVEKAAADKTIKVVVNTRKFFALRAPWTCVNNVTVTEEKK